MKKIAFAIVIVLALVAVASLVGAAQTASSDGPQSGNAVAANVPGVRILTPKSGSRLDHNFVQVRFELTNPAATAAGLPNFRLQLDGQDPVVTNSTDYTFNGLAPGSHTIRLQLVDANGTPLAGPASEVNFVVVQPRASKSRKINPNAVLAQASDKDPEPEARALPAAGGALPLLSVIGFGVLLGGIASAMKTR